MADTTSNILAIDDLEKSHPDYEDRVAEWELIEDVCQGSRCVKERGTVYLPKLSGETDDSYRKRRWRAKFFAATKRTKEALSGMLLRKKPAIETGGIPETVIADVTLSGLDLVDYSRRVAEACVGKGRGGTFIDYSDREAAPYLSFYKAEDVLSWSTIREDGKEVLTSLVLREWEDYQDEYEVTRRKRIRRYRLGVINADTPDDSDDAAVGGVLYETWVESSDENGKHFEKEIEEETLTRRGVALDRIPFVFHNATTLGSEVGESPLADIAALNVSHYNTSADLENARHLIGAPTPVVTGVDENVKELRLGAETAWLIENENAKAFFLEFEGKGLEELRLALKETADQMAQLGARLLFDQKREAEAFETHELRANSETAALSQIAGTASVGMTEVVQWLDWWGSSIDKPAASAATFVFNQDFVASKIQPSVLDALFKVYVAGGMSFEAFFFNLEQGELYPEDWDMEKELAAITAAQALPGPSRTVAPDPADEEDEDEDEDNDDESEDDDPDA